MLKKQQVKLHYLGFFLKKKDKITYKESPFKSIIADIRNKLSKNGDKLIKRGLYYVEEMKELTESQVNNIKEKLIKFKNHLIMKNKVNNRIKKDFDDYYGNTKYKGIKDIRYLLSGIAFNEDEDEYGYEDIRYLFNENEDEDVNDIRYLSNEDENKESPFKSIIADIRNKFSKNGDKLIKKGIYYVEEMKKLTESQVNNIKEKLIKFKSDLIMKNKVNNRIKKDFDDYYGNTKHKGIKDIRYLFDDNDINDTKYLFNEIGFNEDKITHKDIKIKKNKIRTTYKESPFKSIVQDI